MCEHARMRAGVIGSKCPGRPQYRYTMVLPKLLARPRDLLCSDYIHFKHESPDYVSPSITVTDLN